MTDQLFRDLLDWFMVTHPWTLPTDTYTRIQTMLDMEARRRGLDGWIVAHDRLEVT